ncbi:MAG: FtsX-like permease family protein [Deltaproteobacteria bacterium]|nr:FtsX-like permease family protein [Deltaproteobacteria bacterium]
MTLRDIAILNLRRRWGKALFVLAGLTLGVATLVGLVSLADGLAEQINGNLQRYGPNILVTPRSQELVLNYGGLKLGGFSLGPKELRQVDLVRINQIEYSANVGTVWPVSLGKVEVHGKSVLLAGVEFSKAGILKPWWMLRGAVPGNRQFIAGSEAARVLGLKIGDQVELKGQTWTVSGILEPSGSQDDGLLFAPLVPTQRLFGKVGLISMVEVAALCNNCPIEAMVEQIGGVLPGAKVVSIQSVVEARVKALEHYRDFSLGVAGLVALLSGLVVLVTMMMSVKERTEEIGVFRAIGFRKSHVIRVVLTEAFLLSLVAGVLGCLVGVGAARVILPFFSEGGDVYFYLLFDPLVSGIGVGLSVVLGLLASLYPAWLAAKMDPSEALRAL